MENAKVLHLGKRESHRERGPSTRRTTYLWLQSTELSSTICKWSACWCCPPPGRPSRSIVPVLTIIFIRVFSPKVPLFLTKHLSSVLHYIVAEQIYMMAELTLSIPKNIYSPVEYFYIGNIWIYSAVCNEIFAQIWSFFSRRYTPCPENRCHFIFCL